VIYKISLNLNWENIVNMLVSVKGTYEKGEIKLSEPPPGKGKQEVIVTFLGSSKADDVMSKPRQGGSLAGKIWMSPDFNAPLDDLKEYM